MTRDYLLLSIALLNCLVVAQQHNSNTNAEQNIYGTCSFYWDFLIVLLLTFSSSSSIASMELPKLMDLVKEMTNQKNFKEATEVYSAIIRKKSTLFLFFFFYLLLFQADPAQEILSWLSLLFF
jgi:hypothetical protein